ncbi:MAG: glycosyl transferase family 1 [Flavobacteriaceae bacterium]|nr:glycosyl transferase family 1 [Flavobacteriaceae bacterium]
MNFELKKILIITYYWPPAGGPGVQRWLKFAKYLPDFGWKPVIFTPENPSYPLIDKSLEQEIPENIEIVKTKIWEPYRFAEKLSKSNKKFKAGQFDVGKNRSWKSKFSVWIRGNFFIPDARIFWVKPSVKFLTKYLKENEIETVVTSGPPHSLHLIGLNLKQQNPNLKWIADFRDPWTEISYYKHLKLSKNSDKKHRKLEKSVFENADITLATSFTDAENFRKAGANSVCITNGFDVRVPSSEASTSLSLTTRRVSGSEKFTLSYVGVLEQLRNPEILWEVLNEIINENKDFKENFELKFAGKIDDKILQHLENSGLKNHLKNLGYLSHNEAFKEMQNSDLLLITNFPNAESKGIIPGKLFEYLATGNQILSFGAKDADVSKILEKTAAGKHFTYTEKTELKNQILEFFNDWKSGNLKSNPKNIEEFSRKNLTKKLAETLCDVAM